MALLMIAHSVMDWYFVCAGRHSKRVKDCKMKAVLIDVVEKKIEQIYDNYQLTPELRQYLEEYLQAIILKEREKFNSELDGLNRTKISLEHKRQKLLEAHYSDAIPLDLMKSEQKKIAKELASVEHEINMHNVTFENILANLHLALDLIENCGTTYRAASDMTKRLINQSLVSRFLVSNGNDGLNINVEFKAPFDTILEPIKDTIARVNQARRNELKKLSELIEITKNHIRNIYGCDFHVSDSPNPMYSELTSNEPNFFMVKSSSKDFLVEMRRIELLSESISTGFSPSAADVLLFARSTAHQQALSLAIP